MDIKNNKKYYKGLENKERLFVVGYIFIRIELEMSLNLAWLSYFNYLFFFKKKSDQTKD